MTNKLFPHFNKKNLHVVFRYSEKMLSVEIWADFGRQITLDILDGMFEDCRLKIFSQYIDTHIWDIGDKAAFVSTVKSKYPVEVSLKSDYSENEEPSEAASTFVINIAGKFDKTLIDEVINFSTRNLSNVLYGVNGEIEDWQVELLNRNKLIVNWFKLKANSENPMVDLINKIGPMELTIDGHITFFLTQITQLNKLLTILNQLLKQHGYSLVAKVADNKGKT